MPEPKKPTVAEPMPAAPAELPIEVYERRLLDPDPVGSTPVALNLPGEWYCRWINTRQDGRWATVVHRFGYVPVKVSELVDARMVTGLVTSPEGVVTRGDRGEEVLVRMPRERYERIKLRQSERLREKHASSQAQKDALRDALGSKYGSEAAEAVREFKGTVVGGTERIGPGEWVPGPPRALPATLWGRRGSSTC